MNCRRLASQDVVDRSPAEKGPLLNSPCQARADDRCRTLPGEGGGLLDLLKPMTDGLAGMLNTLHRQSVRLAALLCALLDYGLLVT